MLLLLVLLVGGWVGGTRFLTDPSGSGLGMTTEQLPQWPLLDDYTVPGLLLVLCFGVLPLPAVVLLARHRPAGFRAAAGVGLLLVAWMLAQLAAIGLLLPGMQLGFLALGALLIALGLTGARHTPTAGSGSGPATRRDLPAEGPDRHPPATTPQPDQGDPGAQHGREQDLRKRARSNTGIGAAAGLPHQMTKAPALSAAGAFVVRGSVGQRTGSRSRSGSSRCGRVSSCGRRSTREGAAAGTGTGGRVRNDGTGCSRVAAGVPAFPTDREDAGNRRSARSAHAVWRSPSTTQRTRAWQRPAPSCRQPSRTPGYQTEPWWTSTGCGSRRNALRPTSPCTRRL